MTYLAIPSTAEPVLTAGGREHSAVGHEPGVPPTTTPGSISGRCRSRPPAWHVEAPGELVGRGHVTGKGFGTVRKSSEVCLRWVRERSAAPANPTTTAAVMISRAVKIKNDWIMSIPRGAIRKVTGRLAVAWKRTTRRRL